MLAAYATAALLCAGATIVGQAVLVACARRRWSWASAPVGLAALLTVATLASRLPGRSATAAAVLALCVLAALGFLRGRVTEARGALAPGVVVALLALLAASIPFLANGRIGVLGVGLINDDMASHLVMADWVQNRVGAEPELVADGYPLGPHALVTAISELLGAGLIDVFAGLALAIPALTALTALEALHLVPARARVAIAVVVALPYLAAAYLAQEAFKEPILALLMLGFALLLPSARDVRTALPLGLLAAGAVSAYSFPGLAWLVGAAIVWGLAELLARPAARDRLPAIARAARRPVVAGIALVVILVVPELPRLVEFSGFRGFDPGSTAEAGLGNLRGHLSPLEALGIWPTSEFRLSAGAGSLPAVAFYAGALLSAIALALGVPRWIRRHGRAIPAALAAAILIYIGARAFGTVYTSAKALAIAAPLVTLISLGGLLAERATGLRLLAGGVAVGVALSSFLVLRQAPVAPDDHMDELAQIRPLVEGERVLFLGRDNFVLYELRGSRPYTHVLNHYDPYFVRPNPRLREVGLKFDFDSVGAGKLDRFPYVVTTRAAYASGPPPSYAPRLETESYVLWQRDGPVGERRTLDEGAEPGTTLRCAGPARRPGGTAAVFDPEPVRGEAEAWSAGATVKDGASTSQTLELRPGRWEISVQYDATRPLRIEAPGLDATLPANLDFRGPGPLWPVGALTVDRPGPVRLTASVDRPPLAGRLLGAESVAHLGAVAATPAAGARQMRLADACGEYVDWYSP